MVNWLLNLYYWLKAWITDKVSGTTETELDLEDIRDLYAEAWEAMDAKKIRPDAGFHIDLMIALELGEYDDE